MKKKIKKVVFHETKDLAFTWKDIKHFQFEDDDVISIEYVEAYYSENNSYDAHYSAQVERMVEETDKEFKNRVIREAKQEQDLKERKRQTYLKLKKEFEG